MKARSHPGPVSRRARNHRQESIIQKHRGLILGIGAAVIFGGLLVIAVLQTVNSSDTASSSPSELLDASVAEQLTLVPESVFEAVGTGAASNPPDAIAGTVAAPGEKPEVLYVGAEYCPFCAAERWPFVLALSRFGTFSNLRESHSASEDVYPNSVTVSFYGSNYESPYLDFIAVEQYTNQRFGTGYEKLESLTPEQQALVSRYGQGGIPFIYFGGKFTQSGANFSPSVLTGLSFEKVLTALQSPATSQAKSIVGSANVLTATICQLTNGEPGDVCQSPEVVLAAEQLK